MIKMKEIAVILTTILVMGLTMDEKGITVQYGEITVRGFNNCVIENGDEEVKLNDMNGRKNIMKGVYYGLIKWECDGTDAGTEISTLECAPCGTYCSFNQQINRCKNYWFPAVVGLSFAMIIGLILVILVLIFFRRAIIEKIYDFAAYVLTSSDRRRARLICSHNKRSGENCKVMFREIKITDFNLMKRIIDIRMELRKIVNGDQPLYGEITYKKVSDNRISKEMKDVELKELLSPTPPSRPRMSIPKQIVVAAIASQAVQPVYTCDQTLYMTSTGKICTNDQCYSIDTYSIQITSGQVICFKDMDDNKFEMRVADETHIIRYSALYKTCDYKIDTSSHYSCKGSGLCWDASECKIDTKLSKLTRQTKNPVGYGCMMDILGCDTYCVHRTACVWYSWELIPDFHNCGLVYGKESELWEIEVEVVYKNIKKRIVLNTNMPFSDLNDILVGMVESMPLYITNYDYEKVSTRENLLSYMGTFFDIHASSLDMPQANIIGDLQMQINDNSKVIYHSGYIPCSITGCLTTCLTDQSSISRMRKGSIYEIGDRDVVMKHSLSNFWLNRKVKVRGSASITFGNVKLRELFVEMAHCTLSVAMSMACEGCLQRPYAVITSSKIHSEGSLPFESNCTWNVGLISCNREPYEIRQTSNHRVCRIDIPKINQTLDITFEYEFKGTLNAMKSIRSESFSETISSLTSDTSFWTSLVSSLTLMLSITTLGTILIKLARLGVLGCLKKEADKA